jgi:RHS repeat-associated protein
MPGRSGGSYRYGFNGKEGDKDFGNGQLVQDYGFRLYNPAIGKFLSVDPLTASYPNSPLTSLPATARLTGLIWTGWNGGCP